MMKPPHEFVLDASVGIKLFIAEPHSDLAYTVISAALAQPLGRIYVPDLYYIEIANILWKHVHRFGYPAEKAMEDIRNVQKLDFVCFSTRPLLEDALGIAREYHVTAYDACYVALSRRLGAPLITADQRLIEKFASAADDLRWLGDFVE